MKYRKLTPDGDYTLGTGQDFYKDTPTTVGQAVLTTLRLCLGEWFLNTAAGVPYYTKVFGKNTKTKYDAVIRRAITGVQGVVQITQYNSEFDGPTRVLSIQATVDTIYGVSTIALTVPLIA